MSDVPSVRFVQQYDPTTSSPVGISPSGLTETGELIRLIGGNFESGALNPNVWQTQLVNGGTATAITGQAVLSTNTTANGEARMQTLGRARFITATFNKTHQAMAMPGPSNSDVIRRWGAYDPVAPIISGDGVYWENNSGAISVVRVKAGVVVQTVPFANFNGATITNDPTHVFVLDGNIHVYEILYNAGRIDFFQDRKLIHRMTSLDSVAYETVHLAVGAECVNINGNTTNNQLLTRGFSCSRLGSFQARPDLFRVTGAGSGAVKNGPGTLHLVNILRAGTGNGQLSLYDNPTAAAGRLLGIVDVTASLVNIRMGFDFYNGLFWSVNQGNNFDIQVVYD